MEEALSSEGEDEEEEETGQEGNVLKVGVVRDAGPYSTSCAYCHSPGDTSRAHGMWAGRISAHAYQDLIDQGWRRSGTFLYKPLMHESCCDLYTIRLDAMAFRSSKAQRKLLRKWDKYLAGTAALGTGAPSKPSSPTASGAAAASAAPMDASPQRQQRQQLQHRGEVAAASRRTSWSQAAAPGAGDALDPNLGLLTSLLAATVVRCMESAAIPKVDAPAPHVVATTAKQRKRLGDDVPYCCPAAFAIASACNKLHASASSSGKGGGAVTADSLSDLLAAQFNQAAGAAPGSVATLPSAAPAGCCGFTCFADGGHLNFRSLGGRQPGVAAGPAVAAAQAPGLPQAPTREGHLGRAGWESKRLVEHSGGPSRPGVKVRRSSEAQATAARPQGKAQASPTQQQQQQQQQQLSSAGRGMLGSAAGPAMVEGLNGSSARQQQPSQLQPHQFEVHMVPAAYDQESFELFKRYQISQHGDAPADVSPASYTRFLVEGPLRVEHPPDDPRAPETGYGSFHQQYFLDGKLIAVGVVDVLPRCLSSVYFFWEPSLAHLSLGRLSALKELQWVQEQYQAAERRLGGQQQGRGLQQQGQGQEQGQQGHGQQGQGQQGQGHGQGPQHRGKEGQQGVQQQQGSQQQQMQPGLLGSRSCLRYYYMGFYIHTCHKMRYKADFHPSDLLCPVAKVWVRLTPAVMQALDSARHVDLSALPGVETFPNLAFPQTTVEGAVGQQQGQQGHPSQQGQQQQQGNAPSKDVTLWVFNRAMRWEDLKKLVPDGAMRKLRRQLDAWAQLVDPATSELVYAIS